MNNDRTKKIIELREQGKTYQEIGSVFGVTRERIRQILVKNAPPDLVGYKKVTSLYEVICSECGSKLTRKLSYIPNEQDKFFCNKTCFGNHEWRAKQDAYRRELLLKRSKENES